MSPAGRQSIASEERNSMSERSGIPLGLCILPEPPQNTSRAVQYPHYVREILGHAGICHDEIQLEELETALPSLRVLATVGDCKLTEAQSDAVRAWVEAGGAWLSIGGTCGLETL